MPSTTLRDRPVTQDIGIETRSIGTNIFEFISAYESKKENPKNEGILHVTQVAPLAAVSPFISFATILPSSPIIHVQSAQNESLGWWRNLPTSSNNVHQVKVSAELNDQEEEILIDTGANISIIHESLARRLNIDIVPFPVQQNFSGISEVTLVALGSAKLRLKFAKDLVFVIQVWVGKFGGSTKMILGTDFMIGAGLSINLKDGICFFPNNVVVPINHFQRCVAVSEERDNVASPPSPLKSFRQNVEPTIFAIANINDEIDASIFSAERFNPENVDQTLLDEPKFIKESADLTAEDLKDQLAIIPEISEVDTEPVDMSKANIGGEGLPTEEVDKMRQVLEDNKDLFISSGNALPPPAKGVVCDIDVGDNKPVAQRARRIPPHLLGRLYELLRGLLRAGLIRHSKSAWASPIVIVMKKNGKDIRLCIDYRLVNSLTKLMVYSMPLIDDLLEDFDKVMWYISLDNASGYWAVPMTTRARLISAFICPLGHFEWLRMAQGLKNAPQLYQRMVDNALWGFVKRYRSEHKDDIRVVGELPASEEKNSPEVLVGIDVPLKDDVFHNGVAVTKSTKPVLYRRSYIDDINFGASTWGELITMFCCLLDAFRYWGITLSLPKSAIGVKFVEFLSHMIDVHGIKPKPRNLETLLEMPFPRTLKGVQKFVGSLIYYHRFIENFATYAAPLYELTDAQLAAGENVNQAKYAFEELKQKLVNAPLLRHVDNSKSFSIILYVNQWAFGASICQEHNGKLYPVRFVSRVFKAAEIRYEPAEKEVLALLKALSSLSILPSKEITVYTRYSTLKWLYTSKSLSGRALQWGTMLSPYSLIISKQTPGASCLSTLLTASLTPFEAFDAVLDDLKPNKIKDEVVLRCQIPRLQLTATGYVGSFDGAVRTKDPISGAYSSVIFQLPSWKIVGIKGGYKPGLTVNESEYHGLIQTLVMARQLGIEEMIVFGDSRIALHQVTGLLRCHKTNLELLLNQVRTLEIQFKSVQFFHVLRHFNQSADYMATKTLKAQADIVDVSVDEQEKISAINRLQELLYGEENQTKRISAFLFAMKRRNRDDDKENGKPKRMRTRSNTLTNANHHSKVPTEVESPQSGESQVDVPEDANHSAPKSLTPHDVDASLAQIERLRRVCVAQNDESWIKELKAYILGRFDEFDHNRMKKLAKMAELFILDRYEVLYFFPAHVMSADGQMRMVVPLGMRKDILRTYHDEMAAGAHSGVTKTYDKIRRFYYWKAMYADIENYILTCSDCCSAKSWKMVILLPHGYFKLSQWISSFSYQKLMMGIQRL